MTSWSKNAADEHRAMCGRMRPRKEASLEGRNAGKCSVRQTGNEGMRGTQELCVMIDMPKTMLSASQWVITARERRPLKGWPGRDVRMVA